MAAAWPTCPTRVFYPTRWTSHPDEPWTARKALRRFLEHEWEHTGQVREILNAWTEHSHAIRTLRAQHGTRITEG